jgi:hypothetical protein
MSDFAAASLTAALLVPRGNAHLSRGIARPIRERIRVAVRDGDVLRPEVARLPQPTFVPQTAAASAQPKRISLRLDERQRLRLRLGSAHFSKSLQAILIEALDRYFTQVVSELLGNPCACLAKGVANGIDRCERAVE